MVIMWSSYNSLQSFAKVAPTYEIRILQSCALKVD